MYTTRNLITATLTATVVATGLLASNARAGGGDPSHWDWKGYAAVDCQPMSKNSNFRRSVSGWAAAFANMGGTTFSATCPLVRDNHEGGPNRLELVRVRVRDRNERFDTKCVLRSHSLSGATVDSDSAKTSGTGFSTLSLGPVDANNWGSYSLVCSLPGRGRNASQYQPSYLINYRASESTL